MEPADVRKHLETLYGPRWRQQGAIDLRVDVSQISRWTSGATAIPGPAQVALLLLLKDKKRRDRLRKSNREVMDRKRKRLGLVDE